MKKNNDSRSAVSGTKPSEGATSGLLGIDFLCWIRLLFRHRFHVAPGKIPLALLITFATCCNTVLRGIERAFLGRQIERMEFSPSPIFIIGHWRSGTTLLHELLGLDKRHVCPTNWECFVPNHFLLTGGFLKPLLRRMLPGKRPQDNMPVDLDLPQEDEFGLCGLGAASPYMHFAFPSGRELYDNTYDLERLPLRERLRWERTLRWFLKKILYGRPGRLVVKSPTHTFRVKTLLKMFPDGRFVHIVRDPYRVFQSTVYLYRSIYREYAIERPVYEGIDEFVFDTYVQMYDKLEESKVLIPEGNFCELRYEDLVRDPAGEMRKIYEKLDLGDYDNNLAPALEKYFAQRKSYKTNVFTMDAGLRERINSRMGETIKRLGYQVIAP